MYTTASGIDLKPTQETYDAVTRAFDHFNWALFDNQLPACLLTLQRKGRTYGYFCRKRFARNDGETCDEIALNPAHFSTRDLEDICATLVHEMTHLWQHHFGNPGRGRYHNREWADKMNSLGLHPSDTGEPGGRETGDLMAHYIVADGAFARAFAEFSSAVLPWTGRTLPTPQTVASTGSQARQAKAASVSNIPARPAA